MTPLRGLGRVETPSMKHTSANERRLSAAWKGFLLGVGLPLAVAAVGVLVLWLVGLQGRMEERARKGAEARAVALCEAAAREALGLAADAGRGAEYPSGGGDGGPAPVLDQNPSGPRRRCGRHDAFVRGLHGGGRQGHPLSDRAGGCVGDFREPRDSTVLSRELPTTCWPVPVLQPQMRRPKKNCSGVPDPSILPPIPAASAFQLR